MAEGEKKTVTFSEAKQTILNELVGEAERGAYGNVRELAISYRLLVGGAQPGASIVESK